RCDKRAGSAPAPRRHPWPVGRCWSLCNPYARNAFSRGESDAPCIRKVPDRKRKEEWSVNQSEPGLLDGSKRVAGKELRWAVCFEDEISFSQLTAPWEFVKGVLNKAETCDFFDLICTDGVFETRRWSEEVKPLIEARFADLRNREFGTWTAFLNRF